jgi:hypothetical protein
MKTYTTQHNAIINGKHYTSGAAIELTDAQAKALGVAVSVAPAAPKSPAPKSAAEPSSEQSSEQPSEQPPESAPAKPAKDKK